MDEKYEYPGELHKEKLREIGRYIKSLIPPSMGFMVFVFDYSPGGFFYLSSAERKDCIEMLENHIKHLKEGL